MISNNTYEEIYEILSYMDKLTVMKIPDNILQKIKLERNNNFNTRIDKDDIFNEKNISKEAMDLLCWLDYNYWMSDNKKNKIDKINFEKMQKDNNEKRKLYNPNYIFKKSSQTLKEKDDSSINLSPVIIKKQNIMQKIISKIKKLFNKE